MTPIRSAALACAIALSLAWTARADEPFYYAPGGIAMSGYDVVAYFRVGRPVEGKVENALMWRGAIWYFATPETLMTFEMNPTAYAPQFGGYCAAAVARGRLSTSEPDAFFIRDGKLYFLHDASMVSRLDDRLGLIVSQAGAYWPEALEK